MKRRFVKVSKEPTVEELNTLRIVLVKSALRQTSYVWPPRTAAIRAATKERGKRDCALCKARVHYKEAQSDHVHPVVPLDGSLDPKNPDWNVYIARMLPISGFQVLCKTCHKLKSKTENASRRKKRAKK